MTRLRVSLRLLLLALPAVTGCASERLNEFTAFATAGSLYVQSFHKVIAQAGSAMIAADSVTLIIARDQTGPAGREAELTRALRKDDAELETYLSNLDQIDAHATLLGNYFDAIAALTDGKESASLAIAATGLSTAIEGFNPAIAKVKFANKSVNDYVKSATSFLVTHFEVKRLNENLQKSGKTIETALALQEAAMECIADELKSSLSAALVVRESTDVINPFLQAGPVPASWNTNREAYLRTKVTIDSVDAAKKAMTDLHSSFQQLVQNKTAPNLTSLLNEISKMAGYASAIESSLRPAAAK